MTDAELKIHREAETFLRMALIATQHANDLLGGDDATLQAQRLLEDLVDRERTRGTG